MALFLNADAILNQILVAVENWNRAEFYFKDLVIPIGHLFLSEFTWRIFLEM